MAERMTAKNINPTRVDPTRTTTLQKRFALEIQKRLLKLKRDVLRLVVGLDEFGLKESTKRAIAEGVAPRARIQGVRNAKRTDNPFWDDSVTNAAAFAFATDAKKAAQFAGWLAGLMAEDFVDAAATSAPEWVTAYEAEAYARGQARAFDDVRKPQLQGDLSFYKGTKAEFLRSAFGKPAAKEKINLLASRTLTDLKGVSTRMAKDMSQVLVDGMIQGLNPREIGRSLAEAVDVGRTRANTIARTEIVRAHNEGALDAMEDLGVEEIGVVVEWSTAGDDRVCPLCQPLEGIVIKIEEAHGMLPRHPNCRCVPIPANVGEDRSEQIRGKAKIKEAIDTSLQRAVPKGTSLQEAKRKSTWAGAKRKLGRAPKSLIRPTKAKPKDKSTVREFDLEPKRKR